MATLTYNQNENQEGELTSEERNSLAVGEQLQAAETQAKTEKLATNDEADEVKIDTTQQVEEQEPEPEKEEEQAPEVDVEFLNKLWDESSQEEFSEETLNTLSKMKAEDVAQLYLNYRQQSDSTKPEPITQEQVESLQQTVGGKAEYEKMVKWASNNLDQNEAEMYDRVIETGSNDAVYFAIQALKSKMNDSIGVDGNLLTGRGSIQQKDVFRSQAEVVRAMADPRYENDPAYRQDVYEKLERSQVNF